MDLLLPTLSDAASAREVVARLRAHLAALGANDFRAPPPEPTTCCGRGCAGCVWESYFEAVVRWRDDALHLTQATEAQQSSAQIKTG